MAGRSHMRLRSITPKPGVSMQALARGFGAPDVYTAGGSGSEAMVNFGAVRASADGEVLGNRDMVTRRARHLVRNNGWAAGAIAKELDAVIGQNFRPLFKPDWKALGLSAQWAAEFKEQVQGLWRSHADDPRMYGDTMRATTLPGLFALAYRTYCIEGEALGVLGWDRRRPTHTTLRVMDPDMLANPAGRSNGPHLRDGVELDGFGIASVYHFLVSHPADPYAGGDSLTTKPMARELRHGRPKVLHYFDINRPGQTRGISRLAPVIEKLKMEDHYSRVELQAAVINAVLAAFIKSPMGPEALDDLFGEGDGTAALTYQAGRSRFYKDHDELRLGGARINTLYPNDEIGVVPTARPAAQFGDFEAAVLRNIASGLGIAYEQLASDWSQTNYSSARAALLEIWRSWVARRIGFAQGFAQPFAMAWLEEMVDRRVIRLPSGAPEFRSNWVAYSRAKWIGPGRGFVDPVKEIQAAALRVALGVSTLEDEAAELTGSDYGDNIDQIGREIAGMPDGVLHPAQESFAKLLGAPGQPGPMNDGSEQ